MSGSVISWLADQPTLRVVRGLLLSPRPRHLRELAAEYGLSPAGVSDIVRRLAEAGVLRESRVRNRRHFELVVPESERSALLTFFQVSELNFVRERAPSYSRTAAEKLRWMDEAYRFYRGTKQRR